MRNSLIYRDNPLSDFEGLVSKFLAPWSGTELSDMRMDFSPRADIEETKTHYLVTVDLPGVPKDDVKIEVHNNTLSIHGERKEETNRTEKGMKYSERKYGSFRRAFTLPDVVDTKGIEASFNNGVLEISVPKSEKAQPQLIKIN